MPVRSDCRGQATPLVAIVLLLAALLLIPMGLLARATVERARAQSAADAAALAGAAVAPGAGEAEARAIASANGARLVGYESDGATVEVTVVVGDRQATARAERREVIVPPRRGTPR